MTTETTTATLMTHKGTRIVTPEEMEYLPPPKKLGRFHQPIPHADVRTEILDEAKKRGLDIFREQWALSANNAKLFGIVEFDHAVPFDGMQNRWSLGVRNSTDSSCSLKGVAGTHTIVCDNMMLSGEDFVMHKKNTVGAWLAQIIRDAFGVYLQKQERLDAAWTRLAGTPVTDEAAKVLILDAFVNHGVAAIKYLPPVVKAYFAPPGQDTHERTMAGLLGSFTRAFKEIASPVVRWDATQAVGRVFKV